MTLRFFIITGFLVFISMLLAPVTKAAEEELAEVAKITALLDHIESLKDAKFIRNDSEYTAKNAAKFLRRKWDANKKEITTAKDFIDKAATKSSTTGKPYLIRLKGAADTPCADYLRAQLKKIEAAAD